MSKSSALSRLDRDDLGPVKPATRSKAEEIWDAANAAGFALTRVWGMGTSGSEHPSGRALDFMVTGPGLGKAAGDFIADYLWDNRLRLRVKWVIWDRQIRSTSPGETGNWEPYRGASPHTDHVHTFFAEGAYEAPAKEEEMEMAWPSCMPFKEGQWLVVATEAGLKARTGPRIHASTELRRNGNLVTVKKGYRIKVLACAFADDIWWVRGGEYWYGVGSADGKMYLKKAT